MKKSVCAGILCLGVFAPGAFAADVVIKGNLSESLEGNDNYFLSNQPSGTTFKSISALHLDVLARTLGTSYLLSSNVSYYNYFGDGAVAANPKSGVPIYETFRFDHTTALAKYNFIASYSRQDVASAQLRESGVVSSSSSSSGSINTFKAIGGATHDLSRVDSFTWSTQATKTTFVDAPTQTPFNDYGASVAWNHALGPTTTLFSSVNFDWFDADDVSKSQRLFWQLMTGVKSQVTHRLTVNASAGWAFANAWSAAAGAPVPIGLPPPVFIQPGASNSWIALADANYQLLKTTSLSVYAAHLIAPTSFGQLQKTEKVGFIVTHDINFWSRLALSANFTRTGSGETSSDFFSAGIAYSYRLARDWNTRISYFYRQRFDDTGSPHANAVTLSLNYDFNPLGNPAALDPVDAERKLVRQQRAIGEVFPAFQ